MSTATERDSDVSEPSRSRPRLGRGRGGRGGGGGGGRGDKGGRPPVGLLPMIVIAVALVATGIGAIIVSNSYDTPREAKVLGPNLAINDGASNALDLNANNSPALVRNPREAGNLVVANRIDSPAYSCSLHVSFDGGGRWTQTPIPAPRGEEPKCFAPDAVFASDGTLYVSYVTLKGRANAPNAVWLSRSTDGGKTLSAPVRTPLGAKAFQVRLTADPTAAKRIYLTYLKADELGLYTFANTGNPIMAVRSDDGGANWSDAARVSGPSRQRVVAPSPAIGKGSELNVLYLDLGDDVLDYGGGHRGRGGAPYDGRWQLVLARSTDRGATWRESVVDDAIVPTERFIVFTPPFPSLAVDRGSGTAYAAFQDGRDGDADVRLWSLRSGAGEWSAPVRVNDTRNGDGTAQYLPKLAVAPNGRLDVVYYDRRADRSNVLNEVSLQASFDEGKTFLPRVRLSDRAFSSRIGFGVERDLADLGSRLGLLSTDDRAYAVWTDTRNGSVRTAKQDIARSVVGFNDPPRLSSAAETGLRLGGALLILLGLGTVVLALAKRRAAARKAA
ncbi:MAG: sialidase family protein [Solirubrobacteraceae bacterium]|nr:sialidase family protein [Solirubrobacteraceae bacterium]